jgi:hypothetical protein
MGKGYISKTAENAYFLTFLKKLKIRGSLSKVDLES